MAFNPELGSTSPAVLLDNAERLDKLVNGPELTEPDRAGVELDTWRGMMAKNEALTEETRQNLIPLSRQYATLAAAQADIANIPEGSTTYIRSPSEKALALEAMNNGGVLEPTGRAMPSQEAVDALARHFDGSNPDLLIGFKDALNKVFASWNLAGQYVGDLEYAQWDENGRMYADLALLGDIKIVKTYQN
ncbi:TPA: hypothetical protein ACQ6AH_005439, partial [Klebsiella pneumoniae]